MKRIIFLLVLLVFVAGCTTKISDIQEDPNKYVGEEVRVKGTVSNTLKIGQLSGFTLNQDDDKISVRSDTLPKEGDVVVVKGVVMQELFIGEYILAKDVR